MSDLVQIVYISRSTFKPLPAARGIEPTVARILVQSRINNPRRGLVGALYFGDGCFFQCLEGRSEDVDRLYAALLEDPRHTDLKVLSRRSIEKTQFDSWSMKYVPLDAQMKELLAQRALTSFDPYRFDADTVARVLEMLRTRADVEPAAVSLGGRGEAEVADRALRYARWALVSAASALLVAVGTAVASIA